MAQGIARHNYKEPAPYVVYTPAPGPTWSATEKNANVALSNGNLTVSTATSGNNFSGRATPAGNVTSGSKKYWEVHIDNWSGVGFGVGVGIANSSETYADGDWLGGQANGIAYFSDDGNVYRSGSIIASLQQHAGIGSTTCVAISGGSKIWFRVSGGNWNNDILANQDPANNIGGIDISALGDVTAGYNLWNQAGTSDQATVSFSTFSFSVPSGFSGF